MPISIWLGNVFNGCYSSHVLVLFIDVLMSGFGKPVGNSVNDLWFTEKKLNFMSTFNLLRNAFDRNSRYSCECFGITNIDHFGLIYHEAMLWGQSNRSINKIDNYFMSSYP